MWNLQESSETVMLKEQLAVWPNWFFTTYLITYTGLSSGSITGGSAHCGKTSTENVVSFFLLRTRGFSHETFLDSSADRLLYTEMSSGHIISRSRNKSTKLVSNRHLVPTYTCIYTDISTCHKALTFSCHTLAT